jgi:hypothetical protein
MFLMQQTRKQRNLAIEGKLRTRRRLTVIVLACIALAVAAVLGYLAWDSVNRATLMHWNGTRIRTADLRYMHALEFGPAAAPTAQTREFAYTSLAFTLALMDMARENNQGITAEEYEISTAEVENIRTWMRENGGAGIVRGTSAPRMLQLNSTMQFMFGHLLDLLVPTYTPDEEAFQASAAMYIAMNQARYTTMNVNFAAGETFEHLNDAFVQFIMHGDFEQIIRDFCVMHDDDHDIEPMDVNTFITIFDVTGHDQNVVTGLQQGEISHIFETGGLWVMAYMQERIDADIDEMRTNHWEAEILSGRERTFVEMVEAHIEAAEIDLNQRAWDGF